MTNRFVGGYNVGIFTWVVLTESQVLQKHQMGPCHKIMEENEKQMWASETGWTESTAKECRRFRAPLTEYNEGETVRRFFAHFQCPYHNSLWYWIPSVRHPVEGMRKSCRMCLGQEDCLMIGLSICAGPPRVNDLSLAQVYQKGQIVSVFSCSPLTPWLPALWGPQ